MNCIAIVPWNCHSPELDLLSYLSRGAFKYETIGIGSVGDC